MSRLLSSGVLRGVVAAAAVLLGFGLIVGVSGARVPAVFDALLRGSFGSPNAVIETLVKAAPICLCALCAAVPGRFGLVNIGGEGQLLLGAVGASAVALKGDGLHPSILLLGMLVAAAAAGALWAAIPGVMKATTRTSETVSSLLLNYVAALFLLYLIHGPWRDPGGLGWAQTAAFPAESRLPSWPGTRLHVLVFVAPALAALGAWVFRRTTLGRTARLLKASEITSRIVGVHPGRYYTLVFVAAGALAGVAGFGEVSAIQGRLREGVSLGYGFAGFLVAWLCGNRFGWIPLAALGLGGLISAGDGLQITAGLPFATVDILQGLILLAVVTLGARRSDGLVAPTPAGAPDA